MSNRAFLKTGSIVMGSAIASWLVLSLVAGSVAAQESTTQGRTRVATDVGGGSASDVLNLRTAPGGAPARAPSPSSKLEITCVDESGNRFDSQDPGYRECLGRKRK